MIQGQASITGINLYSKTYHVLVFEVWIYDFDETGCNNENNSHVLTIKYLFDVILTVHRR